MSRKLAPESTRPLHATLAVVLQVREKALQVLLWQRAREPFEGTWALPGGLLAPGEALEASIRRQLAAKVDVRELSHLEQLATWGDPGRDPSAWTLATAYLGLVQLGVDPDLPDDTRWHPVDDLPPTGVRPRRDRPRGPRAAPGEALVLERRLRARAGDVHPRRAARGLRRGARPRGVGDEPPPRAGAPRRDRPDGRAAPVGPRRRPPRRGLSLPRPDARDHRPVRGAQAPALSSTRATARTASPTQ